MHRTQIQLTEEQARAVRQLAQREGRSMAEILRESLDAHLHARGTVDRAALKRRALAAVGAFRSGAPDLGREHDRHAAESFVAEPE